MAVTRFSVTEIIFKLCEEGNLPGLQSAFTPYTKLSCSIREHNPFHYALNHPDIIKFLTDPETKIYLNFGDDTADIHAAAFAGRNDEVLKLIAENPQQLYTVNLHNRSVFYWAALTANFSLIDCLMEKVIKPMDAIDEMLTAAEYLTAKNNSLADILCSKLDSYLERYRTYSYPSVPLDDEKTTIPATPLPSPIQLGKTFRYGHEPALDPLQLDITLKPDDSDIVALATEWGFFKYNIEPDGNCLFSAISHQISQNRNCFPMQRLYDPISLRYLAVEHIRKNLKAYEGHIEYPQNIPKEKAIENYLEQLSQPGTWGDHLTILALVMELKISLVILSSKNSPIIFKSMNAVADLYIIHVVKDNHYESTTIKDIQKVSKGIKQLIAKAEPNLLLVTRVSDVELLYDSESEAKVSFIDSDNDISPLTQEGFSALDIYQATLKIVDPNTSSEDIVYLTEKYDINDLCIGVLRNEWELICANLAVQPDLIDQENDNFHTLFYWATLTGHTEIYNALIDHPVFQNLTEERKIFCLDDAGKGTADREEAEQELQQLNSRKLSSLTGANLVKKMFLPAPSIPQSRANSDLTSVSNGEGLKFKIKLT